LEVERAIADLDVRMAALGKNEVEYMYMT